MELLTPTQYAAQENVDRSTVYRWIDDGKLPTVWQIKKIPRIPSNVKPINVNT